MGSMSRLFVEIAEPQETELDVALATQISPRAGRVVTALYLCCLRFVLRSVVI